jgi:hypothetical protein
VGTFGSDVVDEIKDIRAIRDIINTTAVGVVGRAANLRSISTLVHGARPRVKLA